MLNFFILCNAIVFVANAVVFHEPFDDQKKWVESKVKSDYGKFIISHGNFFADAQINLGLKTSEDAKFYAASAPVGEITNKDKDLIVSLSVKHEQGLDCGGGYIKLLSDLDPKKFSGDSEYFLMFGPDKCGSDRRVHIIINYKNENHLWKKKPVFPDDKLTHVYTFILTPKNTYEFYIDQEKKEHGSLTDDWDLLPPKTIDDPNDHKPEDWVESATIEDVTDKKPDDWGTEPERIPDAEAKKPDDWDDSEDGEWEVPMIANPEYKGEWSPRRIPNPEYKGEWKAKTIKNPKFVDDKDLYLIRKPIKYVGLDIWQVKSGTIFDNIIIGHTLSEVDAIIDRTWGATKEAEQKAETEYTTEKADDKGSDEGKPDDDKNDDL